MPFHVGARFGSHEILGLLGTGGMGAVYRARDTKLNRDVALKVLLPDVANDPERLARFRREAQVLASLNHPHIGAIHGLEESEGTIALVLELVPGSTLADRIARGPIPLDEALLIAKQIAEALEAAHEAGIIHRDLKPANVKVREDGAVKVLDFGLAKLTDVEQDSSPAAGAGSGDPAYTRSPTLTSPAHRRQCYGGQATEAGVILGTAAYMSPEQAAGKRVDTRTDLWSFGCLLYEMLAGRSAFEGESVTEVLASVIKTEPDWTRLPPDTPASISRLLRRCLRKDRGQRLQHIGDARIEIAEAISDPDRDAPVARAPRNRVLTAVSIVSLLALLALIVAQIRFGSFRSQPEAPEVRFEISTPMTSDPVSLAVSPDGQKVVFVVASDGPARFWLRSLDSVTATPLPGTEGAFYPFWSPDSRSIGFFADGKLQRIDLDGGLVRALAIAPNPVGGTWNADDTILFGPNFTGPIFRTSGNGAEPTAVTRVEEKQSGHRFPQFLPDGHHFLYYTTGSPDTSGVYLGELGGTAERLFEADGPASYVASGYVFFVRQGKLFAQQFDPRALKADGDLLPIADQIAVNGDSNATAVSVSAAGPVAYRSGPASAQRQLTWFDRSGKEIAKVGDRDSSSSQWLQMSDDGRRAALQRTVNGNTDIWAVELGRGLLTRLTFEPSGEGGGTFSADGRRLVFNSNRAGVYDLYEKSATGTGSEELLLATPQNKAAVDWSSDGHFLLFRSPGPRTGFDLWALPMDGDRTPFPVVQTNFDDRDGQFSPDGKWVAYQTNESGRAEIFVQQFPRPEAKVRVSTAGGAEPRWRRDGKELFYIGLDGRLMAVPLRESADGRSLEAGSPVPLFATRLGGLSLVWQYDVSADGQRFLMNNLAEESPSPITVILNWKPQK